MKDIQQIKRRFSPILIFLIIVGLCASLFLVQQRYQVEHSQQQIENIVDYDAVLRAASFEKRSTEDALKSLKDAGVTGMAIYDRTLAKASDSGDIKVYKGEEAAALHLYNAQPTSGITYVAPVYGKEGYFKEIKEDLIARLGDEKVKELWSAQGPVLALSQPNEALMDMKLSISRLQALEVSRLGFDVIVRPTNFKNGSRDNVNHVLDRLEGVPNVTGMVFVGKEVLGYPNNLDLLDARLKAMRIPVVGIEAVNQLQYDPQVGFTELAIADEYSVGRLYTIQKESLKKLSPEEVSQWFYISDIERNIRYNLYPIYEEGVGNKTALETSIEYMQEVKKKLEPRGFTFGRPSIYPPYKPSPIAAILTLSGSIALFTWMVHLLLPMSRNKQLVFNFTLLLISVVLYAITHGTLISQIWSLAAAISAPVVAITLMMNCWIARSKAAPVGPWRATLEAIGYLVGGAFFAAIGGLMIAALLGNTRFFMEFALFRGVKLVFVAPIILTAIAYLQRFPLWKGKTISSIADSKTFIKEFLTVDVKLYMILIFGFLGAAAWVFVGRSGHTAGVPVPSFEIALRRFLENTLYARPREKEFLIGHPALMLASFAFLRRWPMVLHFLFTIAGVIGIGSLVETFCHLRTPVIMSIARGLDGLWLGIIAGIVAILIFRFLAYITRWNQSREVSHD